MANAQKYTRAACGHLAAHYERKKDEKGEYIKFGNQDIDPQKTHLNYNLAPRRGLEQIDFIRQRTTEARTLKRDDVNVMCSWVVTLPEYRHHNQNLHVSPDKEQVERLFFERTYRFLCDRYGEQNVVSAYVHKDEKTPHMHFAFVPVTEDKKRGGEKVSAKEVITKNDLKTFHTDLERHLDSFRDWHFEVVNEATKDGNKEIAELKKQTAHEEVLKAQQEALQARQRALQEQESIKPLVEQKNALRGEAPTPRRAPCFETQCQNSYGVTFDKSNKTRLGDGALRSGFRIILAETAERKSESFLFRRRRRNNPKKREVKGFEGWRFPQGNTTPYLDFSLAWYALPIERLFVPEVALRVGACGA